MNAGDKVWVEAEFLGQRGQEAKIAIKSSGSVTNWDGESQISVPVDALTPPSLPEAVAGNASAPVGEKRQPSGVQPRSIETAWLIERGGLCLGFCEYKFAWVTFTDDNALRFSRKIDAYSFKETIKWEPKWSHRLDDSVITEHQWG